MKEDFGRMADQHVAAGAVVAIGVRDFEMQGPLGIIGGRTGGVVGIDEKPVQTYRVSARMDMMSPPTLELVPVERCFDMPSLLEAALAAGRAVRCNRMDGHGLDDGRIADSERANNDFAKVFL